MAHFNHGSRNKTNRTDNTYTHTHTLAQNGSNTHFFCISIKLTFAFRWPSIPIASTNTVSSTQLIINQLNIWELSIVLSSCWDCLFSTSKARWKEIQLIVCVPLYRSGGGGIECHCYQIFMPLCPFKCTWIENENDFFQFFPPFISVFVFLVQCERIHSSFKCVHVKHINKNYIQPEFSVFWMMVKYEHTYNNKRTKNIPHSMTTDAHRVFFPEIFMHLLKKIMLGRLYSSCILNISVILHKRAYIYLEIKMFWKVDDFTRKKSSKTLCAWRSVRIFSIFFVNMYILTNIDLPWLKSQNFFCCFLFTASFSSSCPPFISYQPFCRHWMWKYNNCYRIVSERKRKEKYSQRTYISDPMEEHKFYRFGRGFFLLRCEKVIFWAWAWKPIDCSTEPHTYEPRKNDTKQTKYEGRKEKRKI